jgi:hypothetical protein
MDYAFNTLGRMKMLTQLWLVILKDTFNLGDLVVEGKKVLIV